jgi:hypothetical protein
MVTALSISLVFIGVTADLLPRPDVDGNSGRLGQHGGGLPPAWILNKLEPPAGEKNMGSWISSVYTPEQQERLGVDENGEAVSTGDSATNSQTSELSSRQEGTAPMSGRAHDTKPVLFVFLPVAAVVVFATSAMLLASARGDASAVTTPHTS